MFNLIDYCSSYSFTFRCSSCYSFSSCSWSALIFWTSSGERIPFGFLSDGFDLTETFSSSMTSLVRPRSSSLSESGSFFSVVYDYSSPSRSSIGFMAGSFALATITFDCSIALPESPVPDPLRACLYVLRKEVKSWPLYTFVPFIVLLVWLFRKSSKWV